MASRVSVLNQKGGVGKTTTTVNLAVSLAKRGLRTLVVDFDGQRNATQFLGLGDGDPAAGTDSFVLDGVFRPVRNVLVSGLDVIPATTRHERLEPQLLESIVKGPRRFKAALDAVERDYSFVLTDCGPTLGMLALNAVVACPLVLIPIELAHAAAMGAVSMRQWLEDVRLNVEPAVQIVGVLGTFADERERTPREMLSLLRRIFGDDLFQTTIHTSAAIRDAAGRGRPIVLDAPKNRGAEEYQSLTQEVVNRVA